MSEKYKPQQKSEIPESIRQEQATGYEDKKLTLILQQVKEELVHYGIKKLDEKVTSTHISMLLAGRQDILGSEVAKFLQSMPPLELERIINE